jgi:hypothetical protein
MVHGKREQAEQRECKLCGGGEHVRRGATTIVKNRH